MCSYIFTSRPPLPLPTQPHTAIQQAPPPPAYKCKYFNKPLSELKEQGVYKDPTDSGVEYKVPYFIQESTDSLSPFVDVQLDSVGFGVHEYVRPHEPVLANINKHQKLTFTPPVAATYLIRNFLMELPKPLLSRNTIYAKLHESRNLLDDWSEVLAQLDDLEYQLAEHLIKFFHYFAKAKKIPIPYMEMGERIYYILIREPYIEIRSDPNAHHSRKPHPDLTRKKVIFAHLVEYPKSIFETAQKIRENRIQEVTEMQGTEKSSTSIAT